MDSSRKAIRQAISNVAQEILMKLMIIELIIIYTLISGFSRENRKLSGKFTFPRGFETLFGPISSRA